MTSGLGPDSRACCLKTDGQVASWLGQCLGTEITGGLRVSCNTKRAANRDAQTLRLAAPSLRTSQSVLDAYYRRPYSRMDKPKVGITAAHKFARLIYTMLKSG